MSQQKLKVNIREVYKDEFYVGQIVAHDIYLGNGMLFLKSGSPITEKMQDRLNQLSEKLYSLDIQNYYKETVEKFKNIMTDVSQSRILEDKELLEMTEPFLNKMLYNRGFIQILTKMRNTDEYTFEHNINVSVLSMTLAKWLNYPIEKIRLIGEAGMLHDIGKSFIPLHILNKPRKLTDEEFIIMKNHSLLGYQYLIENKFDPAICLGALEHHEKINGSGYPVGLSGDQISESAQLIAIADIYHAMISKRVYKDAINPFEVFKFIQTLYEQYNPKYLMIFVESMLQSLVGVEVLLSNKKAAKVLYINKNVIEKPIVQYVDNSEIIDLNNHFPLSILSLA